MLEIQNLHATVDGKQILKGLDLTIGAGEVHAIMGPNGSGKSTLSYVLAGRDGYEVTEGVRHSIRATTCWTLDAGGAGAAGVFLAFQYPVEIPGVANTTFLKTALNAVRKRAASPSSTRCSSSSWSRDQGEELGIAEDMLKRPVNVGFSGGEKKRNEMLQMAVLEPTLAILDETDSGLDIDALKIVADGVNALRAPDRAMLVITHYQRLLDYIVPDLVHVLADGRIVRSGGRSWPTSWRRKATAVIRRTGRRHRNETDAIVEPLHRPALRQPLCGDRGVVAGKRFALVAGHAHGSTRPFSPAGAAVDAGRALEIHEPSIRSPPVTSRPLSRLRRMTRHRPPHPLLPTPSPASSFSMVCCKPRRQSACPKACAC